MSDQPNDDKKIIIDEDWKSQVEAERDAGPQTSEPEPSAQPKDEVRWPEPSLPLLVTTLATQAMAALGLFPHPVSGKTNIDLPQARHFIDTIEMLQRKTEGNRGPEESSMFEETLYELRMAFVAVRDRPAAT
ncbi:MAG: DUF1844 domain-containing protein [Pirellulales bacterium]|nr:DUF1844 domain-containing protein [Pirellulales bacterium]